MTRGIYKATVLATKKETTEGTLVLPTAGTDFVPMQPDASIVPNIESLANDEIRSSIGQAKPIQGLETPEASFSLYLKHSGTEGVAPNYGELLEACFGSTSVQSTERTTTSSSTVSLVKLAAGGSDYARGKAILLKDSTNGYQIRPVHSVSSNDLTLGFNLSNAPASGVTCGKFVNFSPANDSHPSVSVIQYAGNGHSIQAMAGGKVTEFSMEAAAGELINASYTLAGTKYFFNPIEITASTDTLDIYDGSSEYAITIANKIFRDPKELADAIATGMNATASADTFTCTYSNTTGKFTLTSNGSTFALRFATGAQTAQTIATKIGFTVADETGALTYTSDSAMSYAAPYTVSFDAADPLVAKNNQVFFGDATDNVNFCANSISFTFSNENTPVKCIGAETGVDANFFQGRTVTVSMTGVIEKFDASFFNKYLNNTEARFMYAFGEKSGGNWVAGKCGCIYIPTCTVSSFETQDLDGVIGITVELTGFVDASGNGEVYLNFL